MIVTHKYVHKLIGTIVTPKHVHNSSRIFTHSHISPYTTTFPNALAFLHYPLNTFITHNGGKLFLQTGHWSLYLIHPSRQAVWKMCRQGVTM